MSIKIVEPLHMTENYKELIELYYKDRHKNGDARIALLNTLLESELVLKNNLKKNPIPQNEEKEKEEKEEKEKEEKQKKYIISNVDNIEKKSIYLDGKEYSILIESNTHDNNNTIYYILYNNGILYTYKTTNQGNDKVELYTDQKDIKRLRYELYSNILNDERRKKELDSLENKIKVENKIKDGLIHTKLLGSDSYQNRQGDGQTGYEIESQYCHIYLSNNILYYEISNTKEGNGINKKELNSIDRDDIVKVISALHEIADNTSGGKKASSTYKLNGEKVSLLINKKKLHRSVYVKGNGKAKYCKINNEFVLLSKLKNKIIA